MTATSESLSLQGSDGGDLWSGKRLPSVSFKLSKIAPLMTLIIAAT